MREYEGLFIIDPGKEQSLKEIAKSITSPITKDKGKINKEENRGKQKLSHLVKKNHEGIYYKLDFSIDPAKICALKNSYKLNADILRVMITLK